MFMSLLSIMVVAKNTFRFEPFTRSWQGRHNPFLSIFSILGEISSVWVTQGGLSEDGHRIRQGYQDCAWPAA